MSRYATTKQIKDKNKSRKAETTIISTTPPTDSDIYINVTTPERLDLLANQFYNDATQWWIIAAANGLGKGTLFTPENIILRIPINENQQDYIAQLNSER
jgi:hypothetical protein